MFSTWLLQAMMVCSAAAGSVAYPYPLGVNLGPKNISAALIAESGDPVFVASIVGSEAYQAFIAESQSSEGKKVQMRGSWYIKDNDSLIPTVPDPPHTPEVEALFADALSQIQDTASEALGQKMDISSIIVPQHFNDSSKTAVSDAALKNQNGIIQPWQIRPFFRAVQAAYGLNTCESLHLDVGCDIEDDTHLVLFVDCNEDSVDVAIADVDSYAFHVLDKRSVGGPKQDQFNLMEETNQLQLRTEITTLIHKHSETREDNGRSEDLRAVVLSGDADVRAFERIRDVVASILPSHPGLVRGSIDPRWAGAVGAAQWAKRQVEEPKLLHDMDRATYIEGHDEL